MRSFDIHMAYGSNDNVWNNLARNIVFVSQQQHEYAGNVMHLGDSKSKLNVMRTLYNQRYTLRFYLYVIKLSISLFSILSVAPIAVFCPF